MKMLKSLKSLPIAASFFAAALFLACSETENPQDAGVWTDDPTVAERLSSSSSLESSNSEDPASSSERKTGNSSVNSKSSSSKHQSSSSVYYPPIPCGAGSISTEEYSPAGFVDSLIDGRVQKFVSEGMAPLMAKDSAKRELYVSMGIEVSIETEREYMYLIDGALNFLYNGGISRAKKTFTETGSVNKGEYCFYTVDEFEQISQDVSYEVVPGGCALPSNFDEMRDIVEHLIENIWLKCNDLPKCDRNVYGTFSKDGDLVCRDSGWGKPKQVDIETMGNLCDAEGKTQESLDNPGLYYVCHDNLWVEFYKAPCDKNNDRVRITRNSDNWYQQIYICYEKEWRRTWFWYPDMPYEYYFNENIEYGSFEDPRDGHVYRTVEYNGEIWLAENLKYYDENDTFVKGKATCPEEGCDVTGYYYSWDAADYACPAGWKLPNKKSFDGLTNDLDYCSQISPFGSGYNAHDIYGLSILKTGDAYWSKDDPAPRFYMGYVTQFWVSEKDENGENYSFFDSSSKTGFVTQAEISAGYATGVHDFRIPIRCVKE